MQTLYLILIPGKLRRAMSMLLARRMFVVYLLCGLTESMTHPVSADESGNIQLDERQQTAIKAFVTACKKVREEVYGNVHFKMIETHIIKNAQGTMRDVSEVEYWSRDNKYFRVDTKTIESTDPAGAGARTRMVLSPDAHVLLRAKSADEPLTIRDWGTFEDGWDLFGGYFFVQAAARLYGIAPAEHTFGKSAFAKIGILGLERMPIEELLKLPFERDIAKIALSPDGSRLDIQSRRKTENNTEQTTLAGQSNVAYDVTKGVVLHYQYESFENGVYSSSAQSDKDYDFGRFGSIPSHQLDRSTEATGNGWSYEYTTQMVDWEPVPLGIFSLEAQGLRPDSPRSVCSRRLATLLIGSLLLGSYVVMKRVRNRATG